MTFSILARDPNSNAIGGAAATGSLCVGGWVLRGDPRAGMSASQGASPSTMWGEDVLTALRSGQPTGDAVQNITDADAGKAYRQLSALGRSGPGTCFTGTANTPMMGHRIFANGIVAGNMLASEEVLDAMVDGFLNAKVSFAERLLASLHAADKAGSDVRGLLSAALLIVSPDHAPMTLRIDHHDTPLSALDMLHARASSGDYATWAHQVPTLANPERTLD